MMYSETIKRIREFSRVKVLLVGDFILDSYIYGDADRISPESPVQVLKVTERTFNCGGAASVAADIAALQAGCYCVGYVGADPQGEKLLSLVHKTGADTGGIITVTDRPTINKTRIVGLAQHRHRQQLLRVDDENVKPLTDQDESRILENIKNQVQSCDVICLEDYGKGLFSSVLCEKIFSLAAQHGKKVFVDPAACGDYAKYTGAYAVTPNRKEAGNCVGFNIESIADADRAARFIAEKYDISSVVITLDRQGAYLRTKDVQKQIPTVAKNVYDVTGAGDVVLAALAVACAAGFDDTAAVELANIAGGLEVEKFGVATVSSMEMINELIKLNHDAIGKVRDIEQLKSELEFHRRQGKKIVFTNGCFDVLHVGHIQYLSFCKNQGDILVLGLNTDDSVRQNKGPKRPINSQDDRAAVLAAMEAIDYVVLFDEPTPAWIVEQVRPDILVKGKDWAQKGVVGREFVEANGGKVILADLVEGKSSTSIIEKMQEQDNDH